MNEVYKVSDFNEWKNVAVSLCKKSRYRVLAYLAKRNDGSSHFKVECKSSNTDVVTEADQNVEDFIKSTISNLYPTHCFIGEETKTEDSQINLTENDSEPTWVVDPIDGTMNFVHAVPGFCISIGIIYRNEPVVGVVLDVMADKLYTAVATQGSFCNGEKLGVSKCNTLEQCLLAFELPLLREPTWCYETSQTINNFLLHKIAGMRMTGSSVLSFCRVAEGSFDAFVVYGCHLWDVAASAVIISEAGGVVVDPVSLTPAKLTSRQFIASCNLELTKLLKPHIVSSTHFEQD